MKYFFLIGVICTALYGCGGGGGSDGETDSGSPQNGSPIAMAGTDQRAEPGQSVTLNGASSSDPDDDSLTYLWEIYSSPANSNPTLSSATEVESVFSADVAGTYEIQLTVSDGSGSSVDTVSVDIVDFNEESLVADAGSGYSAAEGVEIVLDGSASLAADNVALTYSWSISSAPTSSVASLTNANSASPSLRSTTVGRYEIELTVATDAGDTATDTASVLVYDYLPIIAPPAGYTAISPADETQIVYVSSSTGNDGNDGLSSTTPVQSIQRGASLLRNGYPDWLALKAGDTWETGIGGWAKSGKSESEPMVITSYGAGNARPLLRTHDRTAFRYQGGGGSPEFVDYLVIHGLHFYAASRDPNSPDFTGASSDRAIVWYRGTNGLLIEDNVFQYYKDGITLQETDGFDIRNVLIKNNVIIDSYNLSGDHSQGIYLFATDNVRIERNVFDHNGWNEQIAGADKTKFNHSIYVQSNNRDIQIVDNIILRSSSHGAQLRSGGLLEGNVLVQNAISLMLGGNSGQGDPGIIKNNVVLHGNDISEDEPRAWGIDLTTGIVSAEVFNNIVAHEDSTAPNPMAIREHNLSTQFDNAVFEWGDQSQSAGNFPYPTRTIEDFDEQAGGEGTISSFVQSVRSHSARTPNPRYDIENIRHYFQEAFAAGE